MIKLIRGFPRTASKPDMMACANDWRGTWAVGRFGKAGSDRSAKNEQKKLMASTVKKWMGGISDEKIPTRPGPTMRASLMVVIIRPVADCRTSRSREYAGSTDCNAGSKKALSDESRIATTTSKAKEVGAKNEIDSPGQPRGPFGAP